MKQYLFSLLVAFIFFSGCQPDCKDIALDAREAGILRVGIIDKSSGENLLNQGIAIDNLELLEMDEDGNEIGEIAYFSLQQIEGNTFISALLLGRGIRQITVERMVINYDNGYSSDTLDINYYRLGADCGNYNGDYELTINGEIVCYRCNEQLINIKK